MTKEDNDYRPAFDKFMCGYWNQMAGELYATFDDAVADFRNTEGTQLYRLLTQEIGALHAAGRFPPRATIRSAYRDPFWSKYDRIVVREDLERLITPRSNCV